MPLEVKTKKQCRYSHTRRLQHVVGLTILLVLQQFEIENVGELLTLVFKICGPQHGPCARVNNLEPFPASNKIYMTLDQDVRLGENDLALQSVFTNVKFGSL